MSLVSPREWQTTESVSEKRRVIVMIKKKRNSLWEQIESTIELSIYKYTRTYIKKSRVESIFVSVSFFCMGKSSFRFEHFPLVFFQFRYCQKGKLKHTYMCDRIRKKSDLHKVNLRQYRVNSTYTGIIASSRCLLRMTQLFSSFSQMWGFNSRQFLGFFFLSLSRFNFFLFYLSMLIFDKRLVSL